MFVSVVCGWVIQGQLISTPTAFFQGEQSWKIPNRLTTAASTSPVPIYSGAVKQRLFNDMARITWPNSMEFPCDSLQVSPY